MDLVKSLKKAGKAKKQMGAAPRVEFRGQDLIDYLKRTLNFKRSQELASLLEVDDRTIRNWAETPYDRLIKRSLRLKTLFLTVERMESDNIPASAILKLLTGRLLKKEGAPTLIQVLNEDPENVLIEVTAENLVQEFKKEFYNKTAQRDQKVLNERFRLTDEQRDKLLGKLKK